jgi:hypothetical protein
MWSGDSTSTPEELAEAAEQAGLDVLCITDHNTIDGAEQLARDFPCRVVVGEEVRTTAGELIGLFLDERVPLGLEPLEAASRIREQGGIVYVPHPFDPMRARLRHDALAALADAGLIDAIEVRNAKTSLEHLNQRSATFAGERGILCGAGSDAHVPGALGAAFVEIPEFDDAPSFLRALGSGVVAGHHWDEPRPWRPRIVPSTTT